MSFSLNREILISQILSVFTVMRLFDVSRKFLPSSKKIRDIYSGHADASWENICLRKSDVYV